MNIIRNENFGRHSKRIYVKVENLRAVLDLPVMVDYEGDRYGFSDIWIDSVTVEYRTDYTEEIAQDRYNEIVGQSK